MLSVLACFALVLAACASGGSSGSRRGTGDSSTPRDGGVRLDAGAGAVDSGPTLRLDSGADGGSTGGACTAAAECDDGLACNGVERCEGGRCTAGTAVVCDDGIACTVDRCTEPSTTCEYVPDDALCGSGESCSAATGCVAGCAESPCRLVSPQCGCPSGEGCYIDGSGGRLCSTAGSNPQGAPCSGLASCTPGNLCINVNNDGGSTPMCAHFCNLDSDCGGGLCLHRLSDGMGGTLPGVTLCTTPCNFVAQTGCRTGAFCDVFRETAGAMRYFSDCIAPDYGTGTQGAPCIDEDDCRAGHACLDPDGAGSAPAQCLHWCNVTTGTGCPSGTTCLAFSMPVTIDGTEYGVCY